MAYGLTRSHSSAASPRFADDSETPVNGGAVVLPSGRILRLDRSRWHGVLDAEELAFCRAHRIPLAYDCAQIGWVSGYCTDQAPPAFDEGTKGPDLAEDAGAAARRLCTTLGARARNVARLPRSDSLRAEAARELIAAVPPLVRDFYAAHGLRAANGLHWALQVALARELPPPERLATLGPVEFTFRRWRLEDAPVYRGMLDNPLLWSYFPEPCPSPLTEDMVRVLIEVGTTESRQETFAVEREGRPVGQCLLRFDEPFAGIRSAEVAYWLAEEHWGKGWMRRILSQFLPRSIRAHSLDVIYAWIRDDHRASARVAERCGLRRDSFVFEQDLAAAMKRPRFLRYALYASQLAAE